jgi:hypothetical protein
LNRKFFNRADIFIIAGILAAAVVFFFAYKLYYTRGGNVYAQILVDGNVVMNVDLAKNATFSVPGHSNVVFTVQNGAIAFTKSDCPDQICVRTGFISQPGQMAVCVPNHMSIRIVSNKLDIDAPDTVAQ